MDLLSQVPRFGFVHSSCMTAHHLLTPAPISSFQLTCSRQPPTTVGKTPSQDIQSRGSYEASLRYMLTQCFHVPTCVQRGRSKRDTEQEALQPRMPCEMASRKKQTRHTLTKVTYAGRLAQLPNSRCRTHTGPVMQLQATHGVNTGFKGIARRTSRL
jgi:hypothetical protein